MEWARPIAEAEGMPVEMHSIKTQEITLMVPTQDLAGYTPYSIELPGVKNLMVHHVKNMLKELPPTYSG